MKTAKVFRNGQSQAVRLPKEFRFKDSEVFIQRSGEIVLLIPKGQQWKILLESRNKFSTDFMENRVQPSLEDRQEFSK